jgi:class 3 adenylate cyclase/tetratricopeptide (TPR) repeat protein
VTPTDATLTSEAESTRKLAAVMFTDIKGFSRKMAENESGAFDLLKKHDALMRVLTTKYGGRVIKSIGDSFMVDFSSAVNAVKCGIEAQKKFHSYNSGKSEFDRIEIRIGIHLGDVIIRGDDIIGDGVNVASRIESITEPTRICISGDVYHQVRNKMSLKTFRIGQTKLKNIPEPVEIHEILIDEIPAFAEPSPSAVEHSRSTTVEVSAKHERDEKHEAQKVEEAKQRAAAGQMSEEERNKLVADYYARAEKYYQLGHIAEAEAELKKIDEIDPGFGVSDSKRKEEEDHESKAQVFLKTARELIAQGRLDDAERETNRVFEYFPLHVGAQQVLLRIEEERYRLEQEERSKRLEQSRKDQEQARQLEQQKIDELISAVRSQMDQRNYTQAVYTLREIYVLDPNNFTARELEQEIKERQEHRAEEEQKAAEEQAQREAEARQAAAQRRAEEAKVVRSAAEPVKRRPFPIKLVLQIIGAIAVVALLVVAAPIAWRTAFPVTLSVAALPFAPANDEAAGDPLLQSIPTLLLQDLSRLNHVDVRSFGSTRSAEPRTSSIEPVSTALNVRHVLLGTVARNGDAYEVMVRLADAATQEPLMSRRFKTTVTGLDQFRSQVVLALIQDTGLDADPDILPLPAVEETALRAWLEARMSLDLEDIAMLDSTRTRMISLADSVPAFAAARALAAEAVARLVRFGALPDAALASATAWVQEALRSDPNRAEVHRAAAVVAIAGRRFGAAVAPVERSLAIDPFQPECHRLMAEVLLVSGDADAAATSLSRATALDPRHPRTLFLQGLLKHWKNDNVGAAEYYEQAIAAGGQEAFITSQYLASAWLRGARPPALVEFYRQRLDVATEPYRAQYLLGRAFAEQLDSAEVHFNAGLAAAAAALERDPENISASIYRALLFARVGKFPEAGTALARVLQSPELTAIHWYRIANVYALTQKTDEALEALKVAVERRYDLAEALNPDFGPIRDEAAFRALFTRPLTEGSVAN